MTTTPRRSHYAVKVNDKNMGADPNVGADKSVKVEYTYQGKTVRKLSRKAIDFNCISAGFQSR